MRNEPAVRVEAETGAVDWLLKQPGSRARDLEQEIVEDWVFLSGHHRIGVTNKIIQLLRPQLQLQLPVPQFNRSPWRRIFSCSHVYVP